MFVENLKKIGQEPISATANFKKYDNYKKIVDFVEDAEKLKFSYKIPFENEQKEYFKDINFKSITKTQKQRTSDRCNKCYHPLTRVQLKHKC